VDLLVRPRLIATIKSKLLVADEDVGVTSADEDVGVTSADEDVGVTRANKDVRATLILKLKNITEAHND
jgi:hypothetical protein